MFDPVKESFHILHHQSPISESFQLLGVTFDVKLVMEDAIARVMAKAHQRIKSLLRGRRFFSKVVLISLYKSQVLSCIEWATPAIYHAPRFFLRRLDALQDSFLIELDITARDALRYHNLAPLSTRRDIAMLAVIHRCMIDQGPWQFKRHIKPQTGDRLPFPRGFRHPETRHGLQVHDVMDGTESNALRRSMLSLVYPYNLLPKHIVSATSLKQFQGMLQAGVKQSCEKGHSNWEHVLSDGVRMMTVPSFQSLFQARQSKDSCGPKNGKVLRTRLNRVGYGVQ